MRATPATQINSVCLTLYETLGDTGRWSAALESIARCFGGVGCDLHVMSGGTLSFNCMGGPPKDVIEEYTERFIHREPRSQFLSRAAEGVIATDLQFTTSRYMRRSDYYSDFLPRSGLGFCVAAVPLRSADCVAYFGLHFPVGRASPDLAIVRSLAAVLPHLNRTLRLDQLQRREAETYSLYSVALDALGVAAFVLTDRRKIISMNRLAESMVQSRRVFGSRYGMLTLTNARSQGMLLAAVRSASVHSGALGGTFNVDGASGERLKLTIIPVPQSLRVGPSASCFLFATGPERAFDPTLWLRHTFRLSFAEARIALILAEGRSLREIGDELHLTYETVRTCLKAIYEKTGVRRQAALVAMISRMR